jgi:hypothetical protein
MAMETPPLRKILHLKCRTVEGLKQKEIKSRDARTGLFPLLVYLLTPDNYEIIYI